MIQLNLEQDEEEHRVENKHQGIAIWKHQG
jgi:hypothetical protein